MACAMVFAIKYTAIEKLARNTKAQAMPMPGA